MTYAIIAAVILAAIFARFRIRYFFKRLTLASKIKKACKRNRLRFEAKRKRWMFGGFSDRECEFTVTGRNKVYAVKLCGATKKAHYDFIDEKSFATRSLRFRPDNNALNTGFVVQYKEPYDFGRPFSVLPVERVILMCPVAIAVTFKQCPVGNGDAIPEGVFYNLSGFIKLLEQ